MQDLIAGLDAMLKAALNDATSFSDIEENFDDYKEGRQQLQQSAGAVVQELAYVSPQQIDVAAIIAGRRRVNHDPNLDVRVQPANAMPRHPWSRAYIAECLMRASIAYGGLYAFCVDNDIPVPFCLRGWRPNKCFNVRTNNKRRGHAHQQ